jgi:chaperone modulatory protein CbpM
MPHDKSITVTTISVEEFPELTLDELCAACDISPDFIEEILDYGVIEATDALEDMRFNESDLRRIKTILRLQNDLEINVAGAALVLDLIEEIEDLRSRIDVLEKFFSR